MTGQRKGRYIISWIIIILVIVHWGYARWVSNSMPDTVWDLLIVAIVVSAGYVVFGEDRFSAAIGEAEDVVDGGGSEDEQQDSGGSEGKISVG